MHQIDYARPGQFAKVQEIWRTCFGDNEQYTDFLFGRLVRPEDVLTCSVEEKREETVVAILCFLPFVLTTPRGNADGAYLFGVATLPDWRGRGFSTALLREIRRRLVRRGVALAVLVPAGEKLFDFYRKRGYETAFSAKKAVLAADDVPATSGNCRLIPTTPTRLAAIRNTFFADRRRFVRWGDRYLAYVDAEARALGGGSFTISFGDETAEGPETECCVAYPYKDALIVKELAVRDDRIGDVSAALRDLYGNREIRFHLPADTSEPVAGSVSPFAMMEWFDETVRTQIETDKGLAPYLAHALDGPTLGVPLKPV